MAARTIGPSDWGADDDGGWEGADVSRRAGPSAELQRQASLKTMSTKLNPFHVLTQSQAQYAAALPPPSKTAHLLTRSPPSHPPPQQMHVRKVSQKNGLELVAGPGPGARDLPGGVKKAGRKALKGMKRKEDANSAVVVPPNDGLEKRFVAPPSPPPSDTGSMSSSSSEDEEDGESGGEGPSQFHQQQEQPSPTRQPLRLNTSAAETIITPPLSHATTSPSSSEFHPISSVDAATYSSPSSSALPALAPPLAPLGPSFLDASPPRRTDSPDSISQPHSPDDLAPLPTQSEIRARKPSLGNGGMLDGEGGLLGRAVPSQPSAAGDSHPGYFDAPALLNTPITSPLPAASSSTSNSHPPQVAPLMTPTPASSLLSPDRLHPSSARTQLAPPPGPLRRNTTGSPAIVGDTSLNPPLSPSSRVSPLSRSPSASPSAPPTAFPSLSQHPSRRASSPQTIVPGTDGAHLDSDILAQAEIIRKERLSRRARREEEDAVANEIEEVGQLNPAVAVAGTDRAGVGRKSMVGQMNREIEEARVLVGNLIGEDHVNYVLMYNMLTGIRIGVSRCQAKNNRPLTTEDFSARHKFSFDIVGNELTPSARYDFKFKDYAPWVFRDLRDTHFHLDAADYLLSLTAKYILSELGSPGKSGSFFYFSRDYRFIIKTISHTEHKFLRSILPDYHAHIKSNPHTLLSRFYGLHRVKLPRGRKIHFVIMNNLFPPHRDIHETYDLKGSSVGREYPEDKARTKKGAVMKDINWVRRDRKIKLGPEKAALFAEQLRRDMEFLKRNRIMDYSLLIGIHNMERGNRDGLRQQSLQVFDPQVNAPSRRKPSSIKASAEASAIRQAVQRSDPRTLGQNGTPNHLSESDVADRKHFLFYQDEGGLRATNEANEPLDQIYYLGVIDICTPYTCVKKIEHVWKSLSDDRHGISAVPPPEYGDRFLQFLLSILPGSDREPPQGLRIQDIPEANDRDAEKTKEHVREKSPKQRLQEL